VGKSGEILESVDSASCEGIVLMRKFKQMDEVKADTYQREIFEVRTVLIPERYINSWGAQNWHCSERSSLGS
jgi:hypothetical protein